MGLAHQGRMDSEGNIYKFQINIYKYIFLVFFLIDMILKF